MERPARAPQGIDRSREVDRAVCSSLLMAPQPDAETVAPAAAPDAHPVRAGAPGAGWQP